MQITRSVSERSATAKAVSGTHKNVLGIAMSVPRLGFMDNFFCMLQAINRLNTAGLVVPTRKYTGAFWGQCLTRIMEDLIEKDDPALILCVDYDTIFMPDLIIDLLNILKDNPHIDAIAPIQMHRYEPRPLFTIRNAEGTRMITEVPDGYFDPPFTKVHTAHMGCMILRTDGIKKLKKPWFHATPDPHGGWGEGHVDEDGFFWDRWAEAGNTLFVSNRHPVGHAELLIRWPSTEFEFIDQTAVEFWTKGMPEGVWK